MYLINQLVYTIQSPTLKILIKFIYQEYITEEVWDACMNGKVKYFYKFCL